MNILKKIILILLPTISISSYAETFTIEDSDLSKPDSHITTEIEKSTSFDPYKFLGCQIHGKLVPVSDKNTDKIYFFTTKDACGWGAAVGPIWIVRDHNKEIYILLSSGGYSFKNEISTNFNLHDISINSEFSGKTIKKTFTFDGFIYKPKLRN